MFLNNTLILKRVELGDVILAGLVPIMWSTGTGAEVMQRIAAPMVGGMVVAPLVSMLVIPVAYFSIAQAEPSRRTREAPPLDGSARPVST
jgi:Cu(I)/Ag(I) efflux system membrane protein CusA/SilA